MCICCVRPCHAPQRLHFSGALHGAATPHRLCTPAPAGPWLALELCWLCPCAYSCRLHGLALGSSLNRTGLVQAHDWDKGSLYGFRAMSFPTYLRYEAVHVPVQIIHGENDRGLKKAAKQVHHVLAPCLQHRDLLPVTSGPPAAQLSQQLAPAIQPAARASKRWWPSRNCSLCSLVMKLCGPHAGVVGARRVRAHVQAGQVLACLSRQTRLPLD